MLNYRKGNAASDDEGYNQEDSIRPCENSEPAEQAYLNRGPYNLFFRSEEVRQAFDRLEAVERSDRALIVMAAPDTKVELKDDGGGSYWFKVNDGLADYNRPIYFVPVVSTALPAGGTPIYASLTYDDGGGGVFTIDVDGNRKVVDGSHNILFRMFKGTQSLGTSPVVTVEGAEDPNAPDPTEGPVAIVVELSVDDDTTITSVVNAINTHTGASSIVTAAVTSGGTNVLTSDYAQRRLFEGSAGSMGGVDNEGFHVPATSWDNFFDPGTGNKRMAEGDILVIDKENAYDRLDADPSVSIPWTQLRIVSEDSRNTADMNIIPVAKIWDGKMYFMNGKVFEVDTPDYVAFGKDTAGTDTLREELADQTGTPYGDYMIGGEAKSAGSFFTLSAGTLNGQMNSFLDNIEDHLDGSVAGLKHPYRDLTSKPIVTVSPSGSGYDTDYTSIASAWDAIRTTGGVIQLMAGTYEETVSGLSAATGAIIIRGMGENTTIWKHTNGAPNPIINETAGLSIEHLVFEDIKFDQESDNNVIRLDKTDIPSGRTYFRRCHFDGHTSITGNKPGCQIKNGLFVFEECKFSGATQDCPAIGFTWTGSTGGDSGVKVFRCYISNYGQVASTENAEACHFIGNHISDCGVASATNDHLINISGTSTYDVQIIGNLSTSDKSPFCKISAANADFRIERNVTKVGAVVTPSAASYAHTLDITASEGVITGNHMNVGNGAGVSFNCAGKVFDNTFYTDNFENITDAYFVYVGGSVTDSQVIHDNVFITTDSDRTALANITRAGAVFKNNTLKVTNAPTAASGTMLSVSGAHTNIDGNHLEIGAKEGWKAIDAGSASDWSNISQNYLAGFGDGIEAAGDYCTISNNRLACACTTTANHEAFDITGNGNSISGNRVTGCRRGVLISGLENQFTDNIIDVDGTNGDYGIDVSAGTDHMISDNRIVAISTGIDLGAQRCVVSGNRINVTGSGIYGIVFTGSAAGCCVTGNHVIVDGTGVNTTIAALGNGHEISGNRCSCDDADSVGISVPGNDCVVSSNWINVKDNGIAVSGTENTITGNNIETTTYCVYATGASNTVAGNVGQTNGASAVGIFMSSGADDCAITGNRLSVAGTSSDGITAYGDNCTVSSNRCSGYTGTGVNIIGSHNNVSNNTLAGNSPVNDLTVTGSGNVVTGNRCKTGGTAGISVTGDQNVINSNHVSSGTDNILISAGADENCVCGNWLSNVAASAIDDSGTDNGTRNEADNAYILTNNWWQVP